ncbi:MAG: GNAT family N-acetyltransferase [Aestuariivirga sp.]
MAIELETERLRLRQWREGDVESLHAFYNDPASRSVYGTAYTREDTWRRIALNFGHWRLRGFGTWALEEKSTKSFAGHAGLWFPEGWDDVEVGYGVAPEHRRKGYATEAALYARNYGYEIGIAKLVSYIQPTNTESIAVATRLGAIPDGEFMMYEKPHTIYLHQKP